MKLKEQMTLTCIQFSGITIHRGTIPSDLKHGKS